MVFRINTYNFVFITESSNDSLSFSAVDRLVRRILKHGADYSTSPHARDLVRDYLAAIGGEEIILIIILN